MDNAMDLCPKTFEREGAADLYPKNAPAGTPFAKHITTRVLPRTLK